MGIEQILEELLRANVRSEMLIAAIIDTLAGKKLPDGTPLLTREEVTAAAEKLKNEVMEKAKSRIAKPNIVVPPFTAGQ